MSLSILIFPDTYEVQVPYISSRCPLETPPKLTGKICIVSSRAFECQSIELELRGDLLVDHQTSFDVLNNLIEGLPPPITLLHHDVELSTHKFEKGHTIVEFSMPLSKKLPPSYEGLFVFIQYTLTAKMKCKKWMTSASIKSASCSLKFNTTSSLDSFPLRSHECSIPDTLSTKVMIPSAAVAGGDKIPIQMVVHQGTPVHQSIKVQIWQIEKSSSFVSGPKRKYRLQYETSTSIATLQNIFYLRVPSNLASAFKVESNAAKAEVYHIIKFIMDCTAIDAPVCVDVPIKIVGVSSSPVNHGDHSNHDRLPVYQERDETLPTYEWCSTEEPFTNPQISSRS
ncbi:hypothetical protein K450DRAFT_278042 [Umbelopsis ramanniana AG]|uniref:Uncharacterized protein n=1 Tax=Umbelopsis ramanniana AG TaxID=1314678 RepID=A0AAD5EG18_UMBRA|nr:uncharacterized protein K450DRAFT_278042 [Umbelopsis ramanniana AG]KAI8582742.1 hypothetical protein K450DRAFT_278042 [Umbelopsis ramanniana AG]